VDDLDRELIGLLRADARASVASLASTLKVARGTVQDCRLHRAAAAADG
jgi:DNA-binding Lrp family transcriptional regulator